MDTPIAEPTAEPVEWLTLKQFAARQDGVSPWLLGELIRRDELPHVRLGRRVLVRSDAFDVLAARQAAERSGNAHAGL